jgi:hypothetical protein
VVVDRRTFLADIQEIGRRSALCRATRTKNGSGQRRQYVGPGGDELDHVHLRRRRPADRGHLDAGAGLFGQRGVAFASLLGPGWLGQCRRPAHPVHRQLHRLVLGPGLLPARLQLRPGREARLPGRRRPGGQRRQLRLRPGRRPDHHLGPRQRRCLRHLHPELRRRR